MLQRIVFAVVVAAMAVGTAGLIHAQDAKYDVEEIMKKGFKGKTSLTAKAIAGDASKQELEKLTGYYQALAAFKPKKGDAASWKEKNEALAKALEAVKAGKDGAVLKKAANCKACHNVHKPKK